MPEYVGVLFNTCFRPIFDKATALSTGIACPFRPSEAPRFSIRFGCDVGQIDNVASERILLRGCCAYSNIFYVPRQLFIPLYVVEDDQYCWLGCWSDEGEEEDEDADG